MGVAQHHDAVSGTEKQEVAFDYAQRLSDGIDAALVNIQKKIFFFNDFNCLLRVLITRL